MPRPTKRVHGKTGLRRPGSPVFKNSRDFPDVPMVKTWSFQCKGCRFNPRLGN